VTVCVKGLIVVYRKESAQDFIDIARRIRKIDPTIALLMIPNSLDPKNLPPIFYTLPTLIIYLVNPPDFEFTKIKKLAVKSIGKLDEYEHFKKHGIACLPIQQFKWGMELDQEDYGDWVVLKPENVTSTGMDINMVPTKMITLLTKEDFPENHLVHQDSYLVQRLVNTGINPNHYRVCVFLGSVLYSTRSELNLPYPNNDAPLNQLLATTVASNLQPQRKIELHINDDVIKLALFVADSLRDIPLLGVDIIRDASTGEYYVIETNSGGNTWHFSSEIGSGMRVDIGGKSRLVGQYNSWDRAAEALVRKTQELAA
jgi:hypothetical protein